MFVPETKSIEVFSTAEAMVNSYNEGIKTLTEAYALMGKAEQLLARAVSHPCTLRGGYCRSNVDQQDLKEVIEQNHKGAWLRIIEKMQLRHLLSDTRFRRVEKQIKQGDIPELTVDNIYGLVQDLTANMGDFLAECVRETFEWLLPRRGAGFKTNKESKVGGKVIKEYIMDRYGRGFSVDYRREQHLVSLDNVFHLLDGKGPVKPPDDLVTAMKGVMRDSQATECETDYFKVRWFLKGTLHIWFKREDLLAELNRIGSGGRPRVGERPE